MATLLAGCNAHPLKEVELKRESEDGTTVAISTNRDVDILFIIDNSGSMAEEQATLARNFEAFIGELEKEEVAANYRIAVTTTDVGHRWALGCAGPENGKLQMSTCRSRRAEFSWTGANGTIDEFEESCAAVCDLDEFEVLPSAVDGDANMKSRPWLERDGMWTNIPDGIDAAQAFSCIGPQGINGCGMEAPLEAMYRAITTMKEDDSDSAGFMRPGAILAVVFVTDEVDCSARLSNEFEGVWAPGPDQDRPLWGELNQDERQPFSDVCWFSGVECETVDGQTVCSASDKRPDGSEGDEEDSVLFPLSRYIDLLEEIEEDKRRLDENADVLVGVIAGVPSNFSDATDIGYQLDPSVNPSFVKNHGVAPGCSAEGIGEAAPPVRLREFADAFRVDEPNLYSVCEQDYSPALEAIGKAIARKIRPGCVETCVADGEVDTLEFEPRCTVEETIVSAGGGEDSRVLQPCVLTRDGFEYPDGKDVCYRALIDSVKEDDRTSDDMSNECIEAGWNMELKIEWRNGQPDGSRVDATCSASTNRQQDCPNLP